MLSVKNGNFVRRSLLAMLALVTSIAMPAQAQSLSQGDLLMQMSRTVDYLQARQLPDRQWSGAFISDVTQNGMLLIAGQHIGLLTQDRQQQTLRNILSRLDGSKNGWVAYPGGPIDMNVTSFTLNVLRQFGLREDNPLVSQAWAYYKSHGGDKSMSIPFKLYLIALGLKDSSAVPMPTPDELITAPTRIYLDGFGIIGDMFYPYMALKVLRSLPDGAWQSYQMSVDQYLTLPMHIGPNAMPEPLDEALRPPSHDIKVVRQVISLSLRNRGPNHAWYGNCFTAFNLLLFKEAQRVGLGDFSTVLNSAWLAAQTWDVPSEDGSRGVEPMRSDVWDTSAILTALSYLPPELAARRDRLQPQKSVRWLINHRNKVNGQVRSMWSFDSADVDRPDSDDSGAALFALSRFQDTAPAEIKAIIADGTQEILQLRNKDGGFAAWSRGVSAFIFWLMRTFMGFPQMADVSQSDITSRLAHIFGEFKAQGLIDSNTAVDIKSQACGFFENNARTYSNIPVKTFVGHWFSNYVYASAQLITGLKSAQCAGSDEWVANLSKWIISVQQPDGGWGESNASYLQNKYVVGRTTLAQTSLAVAGLIDAYEMLKPSNPDLAAKISASIERGLRFYEQRTNQSSVFFEPDFTAILIKGLQYSRYELLPAYIGLYNYARWYQINYNPNQAGH